MLKERVTDLLDEYEMGESIMTAHDVMEELQEILDDEPCEQLTDDLQSAPGNVLEQLIISVYDGLLQLQRD